MRSRASPYRVSLLCLLPLRGFARDASGRSALARWVIERPSAWYSVPAHLQACSLPDEPCARYFWCSHRVSAVSRYVAQLPCPGEVRSSSCDKWLVVVTGGPPLATYHQPPYPSVHPFVPPTPVHHIPPPEPAFAESATHPVLARAAEALLHALRQELAAPTPPIPGAPEWRGRLLLAEEYAEAATRAMYVSGSRQPLRTQSLRTQPPSDGVVLSRLCGL